MALSKVISYDQNITELGHIYARKITRIMEDGKELSKSYHRHVVNPGDNLDNEDARTKAIAQAIHTKDCIDAYKAVIEKEEI